MAKFIDMEGQRFGRLTVLRYTGESDKNRQAVWECQCDCGNIIKARGTSLRSGEVRSCGCLRSEVASKNMRKLIAKNIKVFPEEESKEIDKDQFDDWWMFGNVAEIQRLRTMFY